MIPLERIDLNLLALLIGVHDTGSVSRAARKLGLSQPAASNALGRLRAALGDELFVRGRDGMVPTAFADRIVPQIRTHLTGIAAALAEASEFDPATSRRTFRLSLSGLGEQTFLPPLAARVFAEAPHVRLENISASVADLPGALAARQADLAIGMLEMRDKALCETALFEETYAAVGSPGMAGGGGLRDKRIIVVAPSATYAEDIEAVLARAGLAGSISLRLRHFGGLARMLALPGAVAIVPRQFACQLESAGYAALLPDPLPAGRHRVKLVWHQKTEQDAGCAWLRGLVCALFRKAAPLA